MDSRSGQRSPLELSRTEFLSTVSAAKALLLNSASTQYSTFSCYCGSAKNGTLKSFSDELNTTTDSVTFTHKNAAWYGVDLHTTFSQKALYHWRGYLFHHSAGTHTTSNQKCATPFSFPINQKPGPTYTLSARVMAPWDTVFIWTGFDELVFLLQPLKKNHTFLNPMQIQELLNCGR